MGKNDDKAFLFTLKNAHGVEPTRFMKKKESDIAISCDYNLGPIFGDEYDRNIYITQECNKKNSCLIENDGYQGYECHSEYKSSLFVDTAGPNDTNFFSVLDYEVYCIDNYKEYIDHLCKYPDIIWEYVETKDISEESLKQFDDDVELLNDLDAIHCVDSNIRVKISRYYFENPSELLVNTQIVDEQYDEYLLEWTDYYKWKLIYRASEHGYSAESFHEYCDDKGPTLIVIKSSGGWIFGGYTTQSWSRRWWGIYYDMIY